ncbi:MAG: oligoendopeptidase F, partial [Clostridia bacterium]|nr:oligoendopeptidase F [Clostridia bacterium]
AVSIVKRIESEGTPAVQDYFNFLRSGNKTCPVDILKQAGVDLTTPQPFDTAMEEFKNTLAEFEALTKEEK